MRTDSEYKIPFQGYTIQYSSFYIIYGREINNLTQVKIHPTGVESKNNKGALKTAQVKPEKKALEAFNPRWAAKKDLKYTKTALSVEIAVQTPIKMPLLILGI